ncbi:hypothetical protein A2U01_0069760, partial [Trifolium medium]|nr:hypothetical protein [Trifolium medium]
CDEIVVGSYNPNFHNHVQ